MRIKLKSLVFLAMLVLVLPTVALAVSSPPSIPFLVYGDVLVDGSPAPTGIEISAELDNVEVSKINTISEGKYFIKIPDGKSNEGKMITFKVNGITNDSQLECANVSVVPSMNFDLAVNVEVVDSPSGGGGGGGGGGFASQPTVIITGDANGDGKVDKYDFSMMMADWGQTGSNSSDFNGDGIVNKYDFALLMSHWS